MIPPVPFPPCPVCGARAVESSRGRFTITHDPDQHGIGHKCPETASEATGVTGPWVAGRSGDSGHARLRADPQLDGFAPPMRQMRPIGTDPGDNV